MIDTTTLSMTMPTTLTALPRWLLWKAVPGKRADGTTKTDKVPLACDGTAGSSTDPAKWTTYEQAVEAAVQDDLGVGFVFNGDGIIGIDLDACTAGDGSLLPWAAEIVDRFGTYTELSPSGKGLHLIVRGTLPPGRRKRGKVEMYGTGRYFTMTGDCLHRLPIDVAENQEAIDWLLKTHLQVPERDTATDARAVVPLLYASRADEYHEWIRAGLAMKAAGLTIDDWLTFSARSTKYDQHEAISKWHGFNPTTADIGTLVGMAQDDAGKPAVQDALGRTKQRDRVAATPAVEAKPLPTLTGLLGDFVGWRQTNVGRSAIGLECGMQQIDASLSGWRGLSIMAAAPGTGKTTLCLQVATRIVGRNPDAACVVFSAEMTGRDISGSLLSMATGLDFRTLAIPDIAKPQPADEAIAKAIDGYRRIADRFVVFDPDEIGDGSRGHLGEWMRQRIDQVMQAAGTREVFVVIDNLQQLPIGSARADGQWSSDLERDRYAIEMMMHLQHGLARSYDRAATVVVSETSKSAQERQDDGLTGVLGSGRIVYKADTVMVLTPAMQQPGKGAAEGFHNGNTVKRLTIAKGRLGVVRGAIYLAFDHDLHRFDEVMHEDIDWVAPDA